MPRPRCHRRITCNHDAFIYKPCGVPMSELDTEFLGFDELEAMRLADIEGLYQEDAAQQMGVSRSTFARMLASAHTKVAKALITKKAIEVVPNNSNKNMNNGE